MQACSPLVLSRVGDGRAMRPPFYERPRRRATEEEVHEEELFGPAEGLHATYRKLREEVLEASWKAGRELSEPRLDTVVDVNRAIARHLELLKLAALAQRPGDEATAEAVEAVNGLLRQVATPEQQAELDASPLDCYLLDSERERDGRRSLIAARHEPSLEAFLPRRGDGALSLSASDLDLYLTCPLKYKFAPRLRHPPGADDQPALRHPRPQRAGALPQGGRGGRGRGERLIELFEAGCGVRASGPATTSCSSATAAARRCGSTGSASRNPRENRSGWSGSSTSGSASTRSAAGSTGSTACPTAATS